MPLRHLALISGGLALVPSCDFSSDDILGAYENLKVTVSQKQLLGAISDTIIPAGELRGALELEVPDFILVMVMIVLLLKIRSFSVQVLLLSLVLRKKSQAKSLINSENLPVSTN